MDSNGWTLKVTKTGKIVGVEFCGVSVPCHEVNLSDSVSGIGRLSITMPIYPGNPVQFVEVDK